MIIKILRQISGEGRRQPSHQTFILVQRLIAPSHTYVQIKIIRGAIQAPAVSETIEANKLSQTMIKIYWFCESPLQGVWGVRGAGKAAELSRLPWFFCSTFFVKKKSGKHPTIVFIKNAILACIVI